MRVIIGPLWLTIWQCALIISIHQKELFCCCWVQYQSHVYGACDYNSTCLTSLMLMMTNGCHSDIRNEHTFTHANTSTRQCMTYAYTGKSHSRGECIERWFPRVKKGVNLLADVLLSHWGGVGGGRGQGIAWQEWQRLTLVLLAGCRPRPRVLRLQRGIEIVHTVAIW